MATSIYRRRLRRRRDRRRRDRRRRYRRRRDRRRRYRRRRDRRRRDRRRRDRRRRDRRRRDRRRRLVDRDRRRRDRRRRDRRRDRFRRKIFFPIDWNTFPIFLKSLDILGLDRILFRSLRRPSHKPYLCRTAATIFTRIFSICSDTVHPTIGIHWS